VCAPELQEKAGFCYQSIGPRSVVKLRGLRVSVKLTGPPESRLESRLGTYFPGATFIRTPVLLPQRVIDSPSAKRRIEGNPAVSTSQATP
jgi:hypothetical protein